MAPRQSGALGLLPGVRSLHFVGIGGAGMSGLAEVLLNSGFRVSGSDKEESGVTARLKALGARVFRGHRASHLRFAEAVVYSSAVSRNNPELRRARCRRLPILSRVEMLAEVARLKTTVTVAGSHGKTTTTSMVAMVLSAAGLDPTMVIGGQLKNIRSHAKLGAGRYLVAEADESDGSFLKLSPSVAVVTNVDDDHLDYYGSLSRLRQAFWRHLDHLAPAGCAVLCGEDAVLRDFSRRLRCRVLSYGWRRREHWSAGRVQMREGKSRFEVFRRGRKLGWVPLQVPGRHNVLNALAALASSEALGIPFQKAARGLAEFQGVQRRLEFLGEVYGVTFLDDYGHHPTEIRETLRAVREAWSFRRLVVVFQPHRYSRTQLLYRDFGRSFSQADLVFIMPIYSAGERPLLGVGSDLILRALKRNGVEARPFQRAIDVARQLREGDLLLTLGAGDVWKVGEDLKRRVANRVSALI
ncbi:MAG: UDP-N-acetylmuramate--L-alanine ligase [Elusimicrobia bacterium]|nr:UDP-N-acetylmuramate--L-alanine ligase [Elusimicrobiota bacterium]